MAPAATTEFSQATVQRSRLHHVLLGIGLQHHPLQSLGPPNWCGVIQYSTLYWKQVAELQNCLCRLNVRLQTLVIECNLHVFGKSPNCKHYFLSISCYHCINCRSYVGAKLQCTYLPEAAPSEWIGQRIFPRFCKNAGKKLSHGTSVVPPVPSLESEENMHRITRVARVYFSQASMASQPEYITLCKGV